MKSKKILALLGMSTVLLGTVPVFADEVGAKVEADGSVHVQNAEGKLTRLPETGAEEVVSMMTSFSGVVLLISTLYLKFKKGIL